MGYIACMDIKQRINDLVREHGSLRKVHAVTGISPSQLCKLRAKPKKDRNPRLDTLRKLGLIQ